jgi:hypothetical protein
MLYAPAMSWIIRKGLETLRVVWSVEPLKSLGQSEA